MTVTLNLSDEVLARLRAEAERRQLSMRALIAEMAESLPVDPSPPARQRLSFVAVGSSTSGHSASEADEMLADAGLELRRHCTHIPNDRRARLRTLVGL